MSSQQQIPIANEVVEEVEGSFPSDSTLRDAVSRLTDAGFDRSRLIQPDPARVPGAATPNQQNAPAETEEDERQHRTLRSSTAAAAAAMAGAAAVVATGGTAVAAVAAAAGAGLLTGGGVIAGMKAEEAGDTAVRNAAASTGHLRLVVSVQDAREKSIAEHAMRGAGAAEVRIGRRAGAGMTGRTEFG